MKTLFETLFPLSYDKGAVRLTLGLISVFLSKLYLNNRYDNYMLK